MSMKSERKENKLFHLRPFTFAAAAMVAGVGFSYAALYSGVPFFVAFLTLAIPLIAWVLSEKKWLGALCFFLFLTFLCLGMGMFSAQVQAFERQTFKEGEYEICGQVIACETGTERSVLDLSDVTFRPIEGGREKVGDGKIRLYVYGDGYSVHAGSVISLQAKVKPIGSAYAYHRFRSEYVGDNIKYTAIVSEAPTVVGYRFSLFPYLNERVRETLYGGMSDREASLAFALTTGNTTGIDEGLLRSVRYGGVAHLFAVSGMHVGIVFSGIVLICKKLRLPRWLQTALPIVFGFFFCGLCNFTPSSLRAYILLSVSLLFGHFSLRPERMEQLAFSVLVLLLLSPANLLSAGFLLSFVAYIGVALISPLCAGRLRTWFPRLCRKEKFNSVLNSVCSIFCVQITLLPVQLVFFGYVSFWGFLLNLALIPLFSLLFPVLIGCVLLGCLFPTGKAVFLFLPANIVRAFAALFSLTDFSSLLIGGFTLSAVAVSAYYLLIFLKSGKIRISAAPLSAFLIALVLAESVLSRCLYFADCRVTQTSGYDGEVMSLVQTSEGNVLLLNDAFSPAVLSSFVHHRADSVQGVVVLSDNPAHTIGGLLSYGFTDFYIAEGETGLQTVNVHEGRAFSLCGVDFLFINEHCVRFTYQGVTGAFYSGESYTASADFSVFSHEERDELIFYIKSGILSVERA